MIPYLRKCRRPLHGFYDLHSSQIWKFVINDIQFGVVKDKLFHSYLSAFFLLSSTYLCFSFASIMPLTQGPFCETEHSNSKSSFKRSSMVKCLLIQHEQTEKLTTPTIYSKTHKYSYLKFVASNFFSLLNQYMAIKNTYMCFSCGLLILAPIDFRSWSQFTFYFKVFQNR